MAKITREEYIALRKSGKTQDEIMSVLQGGQPRKQTFGEGVRQINPATGKRERTAKTAFGIGGDIADLGIGAVKDVANTAFGIGRLINEQILKRIPGVKDLVVDVKQPEALKPKGTAQKIGAGISTVAQFIPAGGSKVIQKIAPKIFTEVAKEAPRAVKIGRGLTRTATKMAAEGADLAARAAAQKGETDNVLDDFILGAATIPIVGAATGAFRAVTKVLPKKLFGQIFKQSKDDLRLAFEASARGEVNPTLAEEILERNIFGTSEGMATYMIRKLDDLETSVQALAKRKTFKIPRKKDYVDTLKDLQKQFGKGFFSERGVGAAELASQLERIKGDVIPMELGLNIRRFLDKLRVSSSFRTDPTLSLKQEELKIGADLIRKQLAKQNDEFARLMNEERVMIEGVDAVVSDAVRRGNKQLIGLTDVLLGGGGLASGVGLSGVGAAGLVRGFQQPRTLTGLGNVLQRASDKAARSFLSAQQGARAGVGLTQERK